MMLDGKFIQNLLHNNIIERNLGSSTRSNFKREQIIEGDRKFEIDIKPTVILVSQKEKDKKKDIRVPISGKVTMNGAEPNKKLGVRISNSKIFDPGWGENRQTRTDLKGKFKVDNGIKVWAHREFVFLFIEVADTSNNTITRKEIWIPIEVGQNV